MEMRFCAVYNKVKAAQRVVSDSEETEKGDEAMEITKDFPGGNIRLIRVDKDHVFLENGLPREGRGGTDGHV